MMMDWTMVVAVEIKRGWMEIYLGFRREFAEGLNMGGEEEEGVKNN